MKDDVAQARLEPSGASRLWHYCPPLLSLFLFYAAYVLAGGFGQGLAIIPGVSITFWPPAGIFVAMLLLHDKPSWPWWVAAACLAELTCNAIWFHSAIPIAFVYFAANALEALTAAWLIRRFVGKPFRLETLEEVAAFVVLGAIIAPMAGATVIATTDALLGKHLFWTAWPLVWLGDGTGLLVSTPLAVVAVQSWRERMDIPLPRLIEAFILLVVLAAIGAFSFSGQLPTAFMTMPPLLWAAARFQLKGAAAALALIALMEALFTVSGKGAFAGDPAAVKQNVILLQTFFGISAVSALVVAALSLLHQKALLNERLAKEELEQRVAERTADLRDSQARLQSAVEIAGLSPYSWDPATGALHWDARLKAMFGLPADAHVDYDTWRNAVHPDDREQALASVAHSLDPQGDGIFEAEYRVIGATDGVERWVAARGQTFFVGGKPAGFVGTARDISERKRAEIALRESEHRYRLALQTGRLAVWDTDMVTGVRRWTPEAMALFDLELKDGIGRFGGADDELLGRIHPDDRDRLAHYHRLAADHDTFSAEYRIVRRDDEVRWMAGRATITARDSEGRPAKAITIMADITERKQAEEALQASEAFSRSVLEASPDCVKVIGPGGELEFMNANGLQQLEIDDFGLCRGAQWDSLWPEQTRQTIADSINAARNGAESRFEAFCPTAKGTPKWWDVAVSPVLDAQQRCTSIVSVSRDVTERKRTEELLRHSEAEFRTISNAAPALVWVCDANGENIYMNDRWYEYSGQSHGEARGYGWARTMHPEDSERILPYWQRCRQTGETYEGEVRYRHHTGEYRWFAFRALPQRGAHGQIEKWFGVSIDIHAEKRAQNALRRNEEQLRLALSAGEAGTWAWDAITNVSTWDERYHRQYGFAPSEPASFETWMAYVHHTDREMLQTRLRAIVETPGDDHWRMEFRANHPQLGERWMLGLGQAERDSHGRVTRMAGINLDVTERKQAEAALLDAQRFAQGLVDTAPSLLYIYDLVKQRNVFISPQIETMIGIDREEISQAGSDLVANLFHPDDLPRIVAHHQDFRDHPDKGPRDIEYRMRHKDGSWRWLLSRDLVYERDMQGRGRLILGSAQDITERKRQEEHQTMLMNELNHRVKNTLATIQSMAAQTLRNSTDLTDAKERLESRLIALSKAHDVLTREKWESAPLADVVDRALAPYRGAGPERFTIGGPALRVPPRHALAIALGLHELGTNAVKYGALSNDKGKVSFTWSITGGKAQSKLKLRWVEKGGPKVAPPARKGFGSRLIERGLAGDLNGEVKLTYAKTGVTCSITAPLERGKPE